MITEKLNLDWNKRYERSLAIKEKELAKMKARKDDWILKEVLSLDSILILFSFFGVALFFDFVLGYEYLGMSMIIAGALGYFLGIQMMIWVYRRKKELDQ